MKSLKAMNRRMKQRVLQKVGVTEKSHDEEFEAQWARFPSDEKRLKVLLGKCESYTESLFAWQRASDSLVKEFGEFLMHGRDRGDGTGKSRCLLEDAHASLQTAQWEMNKFVNAMSEAWDTEITAPMRDLTMDYCAVLKETNKVRRTSKIDMDAYVRKLKAAKEKKKVDPDHVQKVGNKLANARSTYDDSNSFLKSQMHRMEDDWSELVVRELVTFAHLQSDLFQKLSSKYETVGEFDARLDAELDLPARYANPHADNVGRKGHRLHSWLIKGGEKLKDCMEGAYALESVDRDRYRRLTVEARHSDDTKQRSSSSKETPSETIAEVSSAGPPNAIKGDSIYALESIACPIGCSCSAETRKCVRGRRWRGQYRKQ